MIKQNFCLVGIDNDFIDFIKRNSSLFAGYFSNNHRYYKSISKKKRLGDHILKKWIIVKRKLNPSVILTIDDGKIREESFSRRIKIKPLHRVVYKNFEFIVIDGKSKDKTLEILAKYSDDKSVLDQETDPQKQRLALLERNSLNQEKKQMTNKLIEEMI